MAKTKSEEATSKNISIYLTQEELDSVDAEREAFGQSRSSFIRSKLNPQLEDVSSVKRPVVIVTSSHKGGVAKTITAANLGVELALKGHKTLLIDLDGQGSLSEYLHVYNDDPESPCIADVLFLEGNNRGKKLSEVLVPAKWEKCFIEKDQDGNNVMKSIIFEIENLDVVPSDLRFDNADSKMKNGPMSGVDTRLYDALEELIGEKEYDYIIIDCPPRVDLVTTNAITAITAGNKDSFIIVPVRPDGFSKRGMMTTIEMIENVARAKKTRTANWILLKTIDEPRTNLAKILESTIFEDFPKAKFFETSIEKAVCIMESAQFFTPLAFYAENTKARSEYISLASEVERMTGYGN